MDKPQTTTYCCTSCGRQQSKIGIQSGELITLKDIQTVGWTKTGDKYLCPLCSGNWKKLEDWMTQNSEPAEKPNDEA